MGRGSGTPLLCSTRLSGQVLVYSPNSAGCEEPRRCFLQAVQGWGQSACWLLLTLGSVSRWMSTCVSTFQAVKSKSEKNSFFTHADQKDQTVKFSQTDKLGKGPQWSSGLSRTAQGQMWWGCVSRSVGDKPTLPLNSSPHSILYPVVNGQGSVSIFHNIPSTQPTAGWLDRQRDEHTVGEISR